MTQRIDNCPNLVLRVHRNVLRVCGIVLFAVIGISSVRAATITSISQNAATVGKYEKFEITFTLSQTYSNPFDPDIVDVAVTFHEPGGTTAVIPGFYYQNYTVSGSNPEQYTTAGAISWKARFAPAKAGTYSFDISIKDAGGMVIQTNAGSFVCQESSNKGFIRVDPNHRAFFKYDNGQTRTNIGHNVAWNNGGVYGWNNYIVKMGTAGENWTRLWMVSWESDGGVQLEGRHSDSAYFSGAGNLSMQTALRVDSYVETARQNGIAIQLAFQYHGQYSTTTDPDWNRSPYNIANAASDGGFLSTPNEFFTNAEARRLTKNKYRYIIARWGYSPAIFAWELFNEVQWTNAWTGGSSSRVSVVNWHNEMSAYIRSIDSFRHPITTSSDGDGFAAIWNLPNIDLVQVHYYGGNTIDYFKQSASSLAVYNKPVIMGEFGAGWTAGVNVPEQTPGSLPEPYKTQMYEALMLHDGIWSSFHVRSSAHLWWWDYYINPLNLYGEFTALKVYAANENLADCNLADAPRAVSGGQSIYATPVISDFYAASSQTVFTLQGDQFPGMDKLSMWLHGSAQAAIKSNPTFNLNMAASGSLKIHVALVSNWGNNSLRVLVNSVQVFSAAYANNLANFVITVPLAAGQQSVNIENTGQDWFKISSYEFAPSTISYLSSIGLSNKDRAFIWIYDTGSQFGQTAHGVFHNEPVIVKGLDNGSYIVEVYATRGTGGVIASGRADSVSGMLTYTLPDFSKDIAVKVKPCTVDFNDLEAFFNQWLLSGTGLAGDLAGGGSVNSADFSVLAGYWMGKCPTGWPF
ncbi:MAG: DUF5060 domain-containing protein [Phycisphaerae bacterium]|jgi:hypothetical protein